MKLPKYFFPLIIFVFVAASVHAQENTKRRLYLLTEQQIERVRTVKKLLDGVDTESLQKTISELEKTRYPEVNLQMKEAMAQAYTDIVREENVEGQKKKEWLYSMVCLNMAYLQFGGGPGTSRDTTDLNRLIRQKLKEYLPTDASKRPGYVYSLE